MKIHYNPKLKERARQLRNNSTQAEVTLWNQLKGRRMKGYRFMRQKPIGDFIVDFFCSRLRLVIEIDGSSHAEKKQADEQRQGKLESIGMSVLRFCDSDVKDNLSGVMIAIEFWIDEVEKRQPPNPLY